MAHLYVDVDDVLTDSAGTYLSIVAREFGKTASLADMVTFDLQQSFGLSANEYSRLVEIAHRPEEILGMAPCPGALETLERWKQAGHRIHIVTGRPTHTLETSQQWLMDHAVDYDSFTIVDKYQRPNMDPSIAMPLSELQKMSFSLAVEDSASMATYLSEEMATPVALLDRPWNQALTGNGYITRYRNWQHLETSFAAQLLP
ncbi:MAG: bifunctional metallophosphatase/5'-nucleotidase [Desulfosarcinaceae bacterium]|nr:bifunctional metallophosphatase/5'-nucleotidase [Desulfosarcinaceae bacterium]